VSCAKNYNAASSTSLTYGSIGVRYLFCDILTGVLDVHLSATANRTNDIMKRMTVWATVAIPFLLITGFFGMNFPNLPWLDSSLGWVYVSLAMIAVGVAIGSYFKYRDWF
jgi:magnesium transporter